MSFYSYSLERTGDGGFYYTFITKASTEYRVYFYPASEYSEHVQNYEKLSKHGFISGFTKVHPNEDKNEPYDLKIENTIKLILSDFIKEMGIRVILLYHCDSADGRQEKRNNRFKKWFTQMAKHISIFMDDTFINTCDEEGNVLQIDYLGVVTDGQNPDINQITEEFHSVKGDLLRGK